LRLLSPLLALLLIGIPLAPPATAQVAQGAAPMLNLVIVEGEGAINNIKQRTQRETIVQVEDSNHRPVAGAAVAFTLPGNGASGTFANGGRSITTVTDSQGRASVRLRPNSTQGKFEIHVTASQGGNIATGVIVQTNAMIAGAAAGAAAAGISAKLIAIIAVAGAAAAGGTIAAVKATGGNGSATPAPPTPTTISVGAGTVGPPR
jgi:hypothetical protein